MRTASILAALFLIVLSADPASARPAEVTMCDDGGLTVVVDGQVLASCSHAAEIHLCPGGGIQVKVAGQVVYDCGGGQDPGEGY